MAESWERPKDPDEIVDYGVDWLKDIGSATIATSTWTVVKGSVAIVGDSKTDTTTTVRLFGGIAGQPTSLTNQVVLSNGERFDQTCVLKMKDR